ncbi:MAG: hypothetical protein Q8O56_00865 [Solirubrobacteraceae bacterium]|nr:hypothetical protein [Solirubrobacteraceae bacterium]
MSSMSGAPAMPDRAARMTLERELDEALAQCARRGEELRELRQQSERVYGRLSMIEQMTHRALERSVEDRRRLADHDRMRALLAGQLAEQREVHELVTAQLEAERERVRELAELQAGERAAADEALEQLRAEDAAATQLAQEQAADAIRLAEARSVQALTAAVETMRQAQSAADERTDQADRALREQVAIRLRAERDADELRNELDVIQDAWLISERRLRTERDQLRREKREIEEHLRAQLEREASQQAALRARLATCEQTLHARQHELEQERRLADEATRWASRVERDLQLGGPPAAQPGADDPARPQRSAGEVDRAAPSGDPPASTVATLHARWPRVRIRRAS